MYLPLQLLEHLVHAQRVFAEVPVLNFVFVDLGDLDVAFQVLNLILELVILVK